MGLIGVCTELGCSLWDLKCGQLDDGVIQFRLFGIAQPGPHHTSFSALDIEERLTVIPEAPE